MAVSMFKSAMWCRYDTMNFLYIPQDRQPIIDLDNGLLHVSTKDVITRVVRFDLL